MLHLINFTQLSKAELKMILQWRNDSEIQKWMFMTENIELSSHLKFVKSLETTKDKLYFLVKEDSSPIGVINFTDITSQSCKLGIYKNPKICAVGDKLLNSIVSYAFETLKVKKIIAEVYTDNLKAITLYKKHNFSTLNIENLQNRELTRMEINDENR